MVPPEFNGVRTELLFRMWRADLQREVALDEPAVLLELCRSISEPKARPGADCRPGFAYWRIWFWPLLATGCASFDHPAFGVLAVG